MNLGNVIKIIPLLRFKLIAYRLRTSNRTFIKLDVSPSKHLNISVEIYPPAPQVLRDSHYTIRTRGVNCSWCTRMNTLEKLKMQICIKLHFCN